MTQCDSGEGDGHKKEEHGGGLVSRQNVISVFHFVESSETRYSKDANTAMVN